jgi:anti-sigma factor RsiW
MSDMACIELVELVTDYLDGALDEDTRRRFKAHLALCDGCDRYLEQFRRTTAALGELPSDSLPSSVRDRLLATFRDWRG